MSQDYRRGFATRLKPYAEKLERETGIPATYSLALAANQTGWDDQSPNLFGLTGPSPSGQSKYQAVFGSDLLGGPRTQETPVYGGPEEAFQHLSQTLTSKYSTVDRSTPRAFAEGLAAAGYSRDPAFADSIDNLSQTIADFDQPMGPPDPNRQLGPLFGPGGSRSGIPARTPDQEALSQLEAAELTKIQGGDHLTENYKGLQANAFRRITQSTLAVAETESQLHALETPDELDLLDSIRNSLTSAALGNKGTELWSDFSPKYTPAKQDKIAAAQVAVTLASQEHAKANLHYYFLGAAPVAYRNGDWPVDFPGAFNAFLDQVSSNSPDPAAYKQQILGNLSQADTAALEAAWSDLPSSIDRLLTDEEAAPMLRALQTKPQSRPVSTGDLTNQELIRSFTGTAPGPSADGLDIRRMNEYIARQMGDPEDAAKLDSSRVYWRSLATEWFKQNEARKARTAGALDPTVRQTSGWEWIKLGATQPILLPLEAFEAYQSYLLNPWIGTTYGSGVGPLATAGAGALLGAGILGPPGALVGGVAGLIAGMSSQASGAQGEISARWSQIKRQQPGVSDWQAAGMAYHDAEFGGANKFFLEVLGDPGNLIGSGLVTKAAKPFPMMNKFVGGFNRGFASILEPITWPLATGFITTIATGNPVIGFGLGVTHALVHNQIPETFTQISKRSSTEAVQLWQSLASRRAADLSPVGGLTVKVTTDHILGVARDAIKAVRRDPAPAVQTELHRLGNFLWQTGFRPVEYGRGVPAHADLERLAKAVGVDLTRGEVVTTIPGRAQLPQGARFGVTGDKVNQFITDEAARTGKSFDEVVGSHVSQAKDTLSKLQDGDALVDSAGQRWVRKGNFLENGDASVGIIRNGEIHADAVSLALESRVEHPRPPVVTSTRRVLDPKDLKIMSYNITDALHSGIGGGTFYRRPEIVARIAATLGVDLATTVPSTTGKAKNVNKVLTEWVARFERNTFGEAISAFTRRPTDGQYLPRANPTRAMEAFMHQHENNLIQQYRHPSYQWAHAEGIVNSLQRWQDRAARVPAMLALDRMNSSLARQNLLFVNFGPMNVIENANKMFLGGVNPFPGTPAARGWYATSMDNFHIFNQSTAELTNKRTILTDIAERFQQITPPSAMIPERHGEPLVGLRDQGGFTTVDRSGRMGVLERMPLITEGLPTTLRRDSFGGRGVGMADWIEEHIPRRFWSLGHWNELWNAVSRKQEVYYLFNKWVYHLAEIHPEGYKRILRAIGDINDTPLRDLLDADIRRGIQMRANTYGLMADPDVIRAQKLTYAELLNTHLTNQFQKIASKYPQLGEIHQRALINAVQTGQFQLGANMAETAASARDVLQRLYLSWKDVSVYGKLEYQSQMVDEIRRKLLSFHPENVEELTGVLRLMGDTVTTAEQSASHVMNSLAHHGDELGYQARRKLYGYTYQSLGKLVDNLGETFATTTARLLERIADPALGMTPAQQDVARRWLKLQAEDLSSIAEARVAEEARHNAYVASNGNSKVYAEERAKVREAWDRHSERHARIITEIQGLQDSLATSMGIPIQPGSIQSPIAGTLSAYDVSRLYNQLPAAMLQEMVDPVNLTLQSKKAFTDRHLAKAEKRAEALGKTAADFGFSEQSLGEVYDGLLRSVSLDPAGTTSVRYIKPEGWTRAWHGTSHTFDEFDPATFQPGLYERGLYTTERAGQNPVEITEGYARSGTSVMSDPEYIRLNNVKFGMESDIQAMESGRIDDTNLDQARKDLQAIDYQITDMLNQSGAGAQTRSIDIPDDMKFYDVRGGVNLDTPTLRSNKKILSRLEDLEAERQVIFEEDPDLMTTASREEWSRRLDKIDREAADLRESMKVSEAGEFDAPVPDGLLDQAEKDFPGFGTSFQAYIDDIEDQIRRGYLVPGEEHNLVLPNGKPNMAELFYQHLRTTTHDAEGELARSRNRVEARLNDLRDQWSGSDSIPPQIQEEIDRLSTELDSLPMTDYIRTRFETDIREMEEGIRVAEANPNTPISRIEYDHSYEVGAQVESYRNDPEGFKNRIQETKDRLSRARPAPTTNVNRWLHHQGYEGVIHIGGARSGQEPHMVRVVFPEAVGRTRNSFQNYDRIETRSDPTDAASVAWFNSLEAELLGSLSTSELHPSVKTHLDNFFDTAARNMEELRAGRPNIPAGHTRLFRGEAQPGPDLRPDWVKAQMAGTPAEAARGRWYSSSLDDANWYKNDIGAGGRVVYQDIPDEVARANAVGERTAATPSKAAGTDPASFSLRQNEFFLPQEYVGRGQPLGDSSWDHSAWMKARSDAMDMANTSYARDFPDYTNQNMFDAVMKGFYPFWIYEKNRFPWLIQSAIRNPATGLTWAKYMEHTDDGYLPVPGTDIQFNPLRGGIYSGGFRRLMTREQPEYYDQFPEQVSSVMDRMSRVGFYPGMHVALPQAVFGSTNMQTGEIVPPYVNTFLGAINQLPIPDAARRTINDAIFPDRYREFRVIQQVAEQNPEEADLGTTIYAKIQARVPLTEKEQRAWTKAEQWVWAIAGTLDSQAGMFRLQGKQKAEVYKAMDQVRSTLTGVPVEEMDRIRRLQGATGKSFNDLYPMDPLQQWVMTEYLDKYQGFMRPQNTPLLPSAMGRQQAIIQSYYREVDKIHEQARTTGFFETGPQGGDQQVAKSTQQLDQEFKAGKLTPDEYRTQLAHTMERVNTAASILGNTATYSQVPKTRAERERFYQDHGIPVPTFSPGQELQWEYGQLSPQLKTDEDGVQRYDYESYFQGVDAILNAMNPEIRQRFLTRIQAEWTDTQRLYWQHSREYLAPYRNVRNVVVNQFPPDQQVILDKYRRADVAEKNRLREEKGDGNKSLVGQFDRTMTTFRTNMRQLDPDLDAALLFWGKTNKVLSQTAAIKYNELLRRYRPGAEPVIVTDY